MRTLFEIIEMVKGGDKPEYDELRYAIVAMSALSVFDNMALRNLAQAEKENKRKILTSSADWQYGESFERHKRALNKSPKEWVGWNNDPKNPDVQKRIKTSKEIVDKFFDKQKHQTHMGIRENSSTWKRHTHQNGDKKEKQG